MTEYDEVMANVAEDYSDSSDYDTDEELKEAFAAGVIKPGLNYMGEAPEKKVAKNNVAGMEQKLLEIRSNLPWVRLKIHYYYLIFTICSVDRDSRSCQYSSTSSSRAGDEGRFAREGEREETEVRKG